MTEQNVRHKKGVVFVPRTGSRFDLEIAPGSGIVGVMSGGQVLLYYEGNLHGAVNLEDPIERLVCAFGRAATGYPTAAFRSVLMDDVFDLIRVGEISWPNKVHWDSAGSARVFQEYVDRYRRVAPSPRLGISMLNVMEMNMTSILGPYDNPRDFEAWRWIEAEASFLHVGNDVEHGVFEFMVGIRTTEDEEYYESPPPAIVRSVIDLAREMGVQWVLFHQG